MKRLIPVIILVVAVVAIVLIKKGGPAAEVEPVVWYGMMPHPYITEVQSGAAAAEAATGTKTLKVVGQEWTQDNENANIKALSTKGHKCFSIFPGDPAGANGLFYGGLLPSQRLASPIIVLTIPRSTLVRACCATSCSDSIR